MTVSTYGGVILVYIQPMPIVAGIDVGGPRKGFHAVALRGGDYLAKFASIEAANVASWCVEQGARFIGVDAPCRWSANGRSRPAEVQLRAALIQSFSTPLRETALTNASDFYGWMLNGEKMFALLERSHRLYRGKVEPPMCFETFPQAVACALAGCNVSAKQKRTIRRSLLERMGLPVQEFTNIDWVDAALCAVAARALAGGSIRAYGDAASGFIVVPGSAI